LAHRVGAPLFLPTVERGFGRRLFFPQSHVLPRDNRFPFFPLFSADGRNPFPSFPTIDLRVLLSADPRSLAPPRSKLSPLVKWPPFLHSISFPFLPRFSVPGNSSDTHKNGQRFFHDRPRPSAFPFPSRAILSLPPFSPRRPRYELLSNSIP